MAKAKKHKKAKRTSKKAGEKYHISDKAIQRSTDLGLRKAKDVARDIYSVDNNNYWEVVVVTLDIRKSSIALVNLEDFEEYSNVLTDYVCHVVERCQSKEYPCKAEVKNRDGKLIAEHGWFDKFTGDGVIVFWRLPPEPDPDNEYYKLDKDTEYNEKLKLYNEKWSEAIRVAIEFSIKVTGHFLENALTDIRKTCGVLPADFGMSVGIDAGNCLLTELKASENYEERCERYGVKYTEELAVSPNVTAIGRAIIGATRMVSQAKAYEIIVNSYPGGRLKAAVENPDDKVSQGMEFSLEPTCVCTKECNPVEAYRVISGWLEQLKRTNTFCQVKEVKNEKPEEKVKQISNQKDMESKKEDEG